MATNFKANFWTNEQTAKKKIVFFLSTHSQLFNDLSKKNHQWSVLKLLVSGLHPYPSSYLGNNSSVLVILSHHSTLSCHSHQQETGCSVR